MRALMKDPLKPFTPLSIHSKKALLRTHFISVPSSACKIKNPWDLRRFWLYHYWIDYFDLNNIVLDKAAFLLFFSLSFCRAGVAAWAAKKTLNWQP